MGTKSVDKIPQKKVSKNQVEEKPEQLSPKGNNALEEDMAQMHLKAPKEKKIYRKKSKEQNQKPKEKRVKQPRPQKDLPLEYFTARIPDSLFGFSEANGPQCQEMLDSVCAASGAMTIEFVKERAGRGAFSIGAPTEDAGHKAIVLLQSHLRHQIGIQRLAQRKDELQSYLEMTQKEMESGLRVEFAVPRQALGIVIGAGGANIKSVTEKTGVDKIVIDDKHLMIRIVGKSKDAVQQARQLIEFTETRIEVDSGDMDYLTRPFQPFEEYSGPPLTKLKDIASAARIVSAVPQMDANPPIIELLGLKNAVETAALLINTELEYNRRATDLQVEEKEIKSRLRQIDAAYGYRDQRDRGKGIPSQKEEDKTEGKRKPRRRRHV